MTPGPESQPKPGSFESHLQALERVVSDLEGDALSLEASIERYKDGVTHLAACRRILDGAEQRLAELVATPDGGTAEKPLAVGPEGLVDAFPLGSDPATRGRRTPRKPAGPPPASGAGDRGDDIPF